MQAKAGIRFVFGFFYYWKTFCCFPVDREVYAFELACSLCLVPFCIKFKLRAPQRTTPTTAHTMNGTEKKRMKKWEKTFSCGLRSKVRHNWKFLFVPHRKRKSICGATKTEISPRRRRFETAKTGARYFRHFRWFISSVYCVYCSRRMTFGYRVREHIAFASGWNLKWTMPTRWRQFRVSVWAQPPIQWQFMQYFSYPPVKRVDMLSFAHIRSIKFSLFRVCAWCNNVQLSREIEF